MNGILKAKGLMILLASLLGMGIYLYADSKNEALAQQIELKLATYTPSPPDLGVQAQAIPWFVSELEKRTQGKVKVKVYWSGSLAKQTEMPRAVKSGLADMSTVVGDYHPELYPYDFAPPFSAMAMSGKELGEWIEPYRKLLKEFPEINDTYTKQNQKIIAMWEYDRMSLTSTKPLRNFADIKGTKIRCSGEYMPRIFKTAGFNPVSIPSTEAYDALQRGMAEAVQGNPDLALKYKWYEVCKYYIDIPIFGTALMFIIPINLDTWKKLPPDVQKIIMNVGNELTELFPKLSMKTREYFNDTFKKSGGTFIKFSETDQKEWKTRIAKDIMEFYIKKMEAKNIPKIRQIVYRYAELAGYDWNR